MLPKEGAAFFAVALIASLVDACGAHQLLADGTVGLMTRRAVGPELAVFSSEEMGRSLVLGLSDVGMALVAGLSLGSELQKLRVGADVGPSRKKSERFAFRGAS
jgi:hypothetical protein